MDLTFRGWNPPINNFVGSGKSKNKIYVTILIFISKIFMNKTFFQSNNDNYKFVLYKYFSVNHMKKVAQKCA